MKKYIRNFGFLTLALSMTACSQEELSSESKEFETIEGVAEAPSIVDGFGTDTRSVVVEDGDEFSLYWAASEAIGVYGSNFKNTKYTSTNKSNSQSVTFSGGSLFKTPKYAYYPYSSANSSIAQTEVKGELKQVQTWDASTMSLAGDFKVGTYKSRSWSTTTFTFSNALTYVKMAVDAAGTVLEGDKLQSITMTVTTADGKTRQLWGAFKANLTKDAASALTWTATEQNNNVSTLEWTKTPSLDGNVTGYMAAAPLVKQGDVINFVVQTDNHKASFNVTSGVDFKANLEVVYAMPLAEMKDVVYMTADGGVIGDDNTDDPEGGDNGSDNQPEGEPENGGNTEDPEGDNTPSVDPEGGNSGDNSEDTEDDGNNDGPLPGTPEMITGSFTCATYNVDGLPNKISFVSINSDGPGATGTKNISAKIAQQNWDFVGFSEDFAYHSNLISSLGNYQWGKHRGSVSSSALFGTVDTDGLEFAANKSTCSWSEENITAFTSSAGGLTSGANTCIKKGFRHYPVTVAEGVIVDVIITHMNTYSSSGSSHINAQHAQLKQIAQYINNLVAKNNRPVIFMGDTNCRYTRHDFKTYFWDVLNSNLTYADPWVEFQWNGVYPTYPSNSLMVSDATGTSSSDIICADTQKGEVVDKIIYINNPDAPVQIKAQSYLRDYNNFNGLADHMPIVATFSYEKQVQ